MTAPGRRARSAFWTLLVVAVLLTGALGALLRAPAGPWTALSVGGLGGLLALDLALTIRLLLALTGRLATRGEPAGARSRRSG